MKTIYGLSILLLAFAAGAGCGSSSQAQSQDKNANFESIINSKQYVFTAQSVTPLGGRYRQLTSEYDLRVFGDSVIAALPYFGRAYSAPIDPSNGGINFTSTKFAYTQTPRNKGGWIITIKPEDTQDVRELILTVTEKGQSSLQVISNNRQTISFSGYVQARKK